MIRQRFAAAIVLSLAAAGLVSDGFAQGRCVSGNQGRKLLEQGRIVPFPEAMRQAGLKGGEVVEVQLCRRGGGWAYRVRVLRNGQVKAMNIPAN